MQSAASLKPDGNITVGGKGYRAVSQTLTGFGGARVTVTILSARSATATSLGSGDFSSPIRIEGHDEFAALAAECNGMSSELSRRLDELSRERVRLREAIRRIGHTFASSLDRPALLELALKTVVDAVQATGGVDQRSLDRRPTARRGRSRGIAGSRS